MFPAVSTLVYKTDALPLRTRFLNSKEPKWRGKRLHMDDENTYTFDPDLIHAIFKHVWSKTAVESGRNQVTNAMNCEVGVGTSKKNRPTLANSIALKLSCELLKTFISEAVQRAALIAEAEGGTKIEATHLERILPQLLLDF